MSMKRVEPDSRHKAFFDDARALVILHANHVTPTEAIAIVCNLLGVVITMVQEEEMDYDAIAELVKKNVLEGYANALADQRSRS